MTIDEVLQGCRIRRVFVGSSSRRSGHLPQRVETRVGIPVSLCSESLMTAVSTMLMTSHYYVLVIK